MVGRSEKSSGRIEVREPLPALVSSAIIGLALTLIGTGMSQFLASGETGVLTAFFSLLLVANLTVAVFWTEITDKHFEYPVLATLPGTSLGFILLAIYDALLGRQSELTLYIFMGGLSGISLWILETRFRQNLVWFSVIFKAAGVLAMTLYAWQGLDAWSIDLKAMSPRMAKVAASDSPAGVMRDGANHGSGWSYSGETGPDMWASLDTSSRACGYGASQSPVDVPRAAPVITGIFGNIPGSDTATLRGSSRFINLEFKGAVTARIQSENYVLKSAQVHTPSEHTLRGLSYPAEFQFYFQSPSGRVEALAVFAEIGDLNPEVSKVLEAVGRLGQEGEPSTQPVDVARLIPQIDSVYRYRGSLTSPPCSEGITWSVSRTTFAVSREQLEGLRRVSPMSARPVRQLGPRQFETTQTRVGH
jgi:carbonic anhydrase